MLVFFLILSKNNHRRKTDSYPLLCASTETKTRGGNFKSSEQTTVAEVCKSIFPVHRNCSSPTEKKEKAKEEEKKIHFFKALKGGRWGGEKMAAICIIPQFGTFNNLLLYSYVSLSLVLVRLFVFHFQNAYTLFLGAQQIPALGEQASQAVTKLCHLLQGVIFYFCF